MNESQKPLLVPGILLLLALILGMYSLSTLNSPRVIVDGKAVVLTRTDVKSDPTGGLTTTKISNYSFLVNNFGGYSYTDTVQHALSSYLRIAHKESYTTMKVDEKSFKQVDQVTSTFDVTYGQSGRMTVRVDLDQNLTTLNVSVTSDNGQPATYTTGTLDINVVN